MDAATAPSLRCPCCGGAVAPLAVTVDDEWRTVTHGGATVVLAPRKWQIFVELLRGFPKPVTAELLYDSIYGALPDCDQPALDCIGVQIAQMRPLLKPTGLKIVGAHNRWALSAPKFAIDAMVAASYGIKRRAAA